jgi:isoleucyl-tRNA synthetase
MFKSVKGQPNFPKIEEDILEFWKENNTFKKSLDQRKNNDEFVFYDGPPFATGTPHYGHLLAGTIKDVVPRYQTMKGKYVERVFGWDCHGLPIEALAQEALNLKGAADIIEKGVDVFNEQCRSMVSTYVDEWEKTVTRMGRWVDFKNGYKTMDKDFMESVWWVFQQLWKQGRIYKSYRIMPYSWRLSTPLSNFEAGSNYKDVQDPAITVAAKLIEFDPELKELANGVDCCALLWTTTPWTLPENLALCTGPEIEYSAIKDEESGRIFIMANARISAYYKDEAQYTVIKTYKGKDLKGWKYEPLFPYFKEQANAFQILNDNYVSTEDGTGIVHLAPAYGEDDFRICKSVNIELVDPLDASCIFTNKIPELEGMFCKDADKTIIKKLKDENKLIKHNTVMHSYPYCDRTDTPLIYRAIEAWYVKVDDMNERFLKNNSEVNWTPEYVGSKRFGNWLEAAKDWNISRNRYWGSCIPLWINEEDENDIICIGSIEELEKLSGSKVDDLHKHYVDKIIIEKDGKRYKRTPEVLDCWFESGSMPYAQKHYPFDNKDRVEKNFPADFIAEGLDQTRGWFYTLMVLGTALFDKSPYQNVIVNGLILAEDGYKMSKRKKNYPDPHHILDGYGADALRLFLMRSPVVRGENLKFSESGVKEVLRGVLIPVWNVYSFFITYANIDNWMPNEENIKRPENPKNPLDRYILSSLAEMVEEIQNQMDNYNLQKAANRFEEFVEVLTNWYIRRSRRRFWRSQNDSDKWEAYQTLYYVLITFCKTAAPFIPFTTEAIFNNLRTEAMPESVHLCDFPEIDNEIRDQYLEQQMEHTMTAVSLGRYVRAQHNLRTRQPLGKAVIVVPNDKVIEMLKETASIISEELNVKEIEFHTNEEELVTRIPKANFKTLGRKLGKNMKFVANKIANFSTTEVNDLLAGDNITINLEDGSTLELSKDDIVIQREEKEGLAVATEAEITIALDTNITNELKNEGLAREFVNKVQNMRKESDFQISDRIIVKYHCNNELKGAIESFSEYICNETLTKELVFDNTISDNKLDINKIDCYITIIK